MKEHEERGMTQPNNTLETLARTVLDIPQPELDLDRLMEDTEMELSDSSDLEVSLEIPPDEEDSKSGKVRSSRRNKAQAKKKHYTEDSIRLYLQEIGRIRLLRADEEI